MLAGQKPRQQGRSRRRPGAVVSADASATRGDAARGDAVTCTKLSEPRSSIVITQRPGCEKPRMERGFARIADFISLGSLIDAYAFISLSMRSNSARIRSTLSTLVI